LNVDAIFPGWVNAEDRHLWLTRASIAALPSTWPEPFGLVGLEAAAAGVATIAFNVGGISEWLQDGVNGVAVPAPPSAEAFSAALTGVLSDRARLVALRTGARRLADEMTLASHLDRLEDVLYQRHQPFLAVS